MSDVTKIELTLCKHSLWDPMARPMATEHSYSIFTSTITILMALRKLTWLLPATERSDLILIFTRVVRFVWVYLELGEDQFLRIGILKCLLYYKFYYQFKLSLWAKKYILMNLALKINRELRKVKRRTKPTRILLGTETSNLLCLRISRVHQRDSNLW